MFREYLSEDNIVLIDGTSEGTQVKYRKGDYWYKEDNRGREGLAVNILRWQSHQISWNRAMESVIESQSSDGGSHDLCRGSQ